MEHTWRIIHIWDGQVMREIQYHTYNGTVCSDFYGSGAGVALAKKLYTDGVKLNTFKSRARRETLRNSGRH